MNLRTEVTILKLEPEGALTVIEGSATDGTIVIIRARVVEPLRVGEQLALTLTAQPPATVGPTMRERMQARIQESSTGGSPQRLAVTLNNLGGTQASTATPSSAATTGNVNAAGRAAASAASAPVSAGAQQTQGVAGGASSMLLSSILGDSPRSSVQMERNVDDEMDALFGARRKG